MRNRDVLDEEITRIADRYWASFFDCRVAELFAEPCRVGTHGPELEGYWGVSALFRDGRTMISIPPDSEELLAPMLAELFRLGSPEGFANAFAPIASLILGPAYVGYATRFSESGGLVRSLDLSDASAVSQLESACGPVEWEHGGSPVEHPCSGVFEDGRLVCLAGYEIWGGSIAHISIVTDPGFRGRGHALRAVAHLATRAEAAGLLPQYRTLDSNLPSIRVAESLGFSRYASSMAVRLRPELRSWDID